MSVSDSSKQSIKHSMSVASGVVQKLQKLPKGINPIIDRFKKEFMIDISFNGSSLTLSCDNEDILLMAMEELEAMVTGAKKSKTNKKLGDGTVKWVYTDLQVSHVKYLFRKQLDDMRSRQNVDIKFLPNEDNPTLVEIHCELGMYEDVKKSMETFEDTMTKIKSQSLKVVKKDERRLLEFEKSYSEKYYGKKGEVNKNVTITVYSLTDTDLKDGVAIWEKVKSGKSLEDINKTNDNLSGLKDSTRSNKSTNYTVEQDNETKGQHSGDTVTKPQMETGIPRSEDSRSSPKPDDIGSGAQSGTSPLKRDEGKTEGKGDYAKYVFEMGELKCFVYKESITEIKGMDGLTNAANENMMHGGGVAYYISKAAGSKMDDDCKKYIEKYGKIAVTEHYVSIAGKLDCKGIIHAVGPQWHDYRDKPDDCAKDLYQTIINILEASKERSWKRIALSAISSGIFGVPKILCAEMYVKAFSDFAQKGVGSVQEVHFIDVNPEMLTLVEKAHKQWVNDPSKLDFKNALDYPGPTGWKATRKGKTTHVKTSSTPAVPRITFCGETITRKRQRKFQYRIYDRATIFLYTGSSVEREEEFDAVVCPVAGRLASVISQTIGTSHYTKEMAKYKDVKQGDILHISGGKVWPKTSIIHVRFSSSAYGLTQESRTSISSLTKRIIAYANGTLRAGSVAMTMLVPEMAQKSKDSLQTLAGGFLKDVIQFIQDEPKLKLNELHIVDINEGIIHALKEEFRQWTSEKGAYSSHTSGGGPSWDRFGNGDLRVVYPSEKDGWTKHMPLPENKLLNDMNKSTSLPSVKSKDSSFVATSLCQYCGDNKQQRKADKKLPCGHGCCTVCFIGMGKSGKCKDCTKKGNGRAQTTQRETCLICCEDKTEELFGKLPCGHSFCNACIEGFKRNKPQCPVCFVPFGIITGNQPNGIMFYRKTPEHLSGYGGVGTIELFYDVLNGKQGDNHPDPGKPYKGIQRRAFLPDNDQGRRVFHLLRRAFDRRLIFTIGDSRTTGKEGVVTWNDIHHKTCQYGGTAKFGYPDPDYLNRVTDELAAKNVLD